MTILICPTCGKQFDTARTQAMPFCTERCRMVDLGRWFNEEYGLPANPEAVDDPERNPDDCA